MSTLIQSSNPIGGLNRLLSAQQGVNQRAGGDDEIVLLSKVCANLFDELGAGQGAAAGTLTGTTLAPNVVNSSLTSLGTLSALTVTAPITGSITGSAPAGTLTGATLASNVLASSLTSVGTLSALTVTAISLGSLDPTNPASRRVVDIQGGGYGSPGPYNTNSNGDKINLYANGSAAFYEARIGIGSSTNFWFKSTPATGTAGVFEWYCGSSVSLAATLSSGGLALTATAPATSTTTGALIVGANVGFSGNSGGPSFLGGNLTVAGTATSSHASGSGAAPTAVAGTGAGTGGTVTVAGTDRAGVITITTGTTPLLNAVIATMTFSVNYATAPNVILQQATASASNLSGIPYVTTTTSTFVTNSATTPLTASTVYKYYYVIVQ
jgi:hypothetical protein